MYEHVLWCRTAPFARDQNRSRLGTNGGVLSFACVESSTFTDYLPEPLYVGGGGGSLAGAEPCHSVESIPVHFGAATPTAVAFTHLSGCPLPPLTVTQPVQCEDPWPRSLVPERKWDLITSFLCLPGIQSPQLPMYGCMNLLDIQLCLAGNPLLVNYCPFNCILVGRD